MNEKCSLSNLSRYLQVIGFLSLIIILIIVVYYYLRSNHSTILEKYEGYSRRDCVVYLKGDIADTEKCDATQGTSNYTDTCSYRFDGWSEFATYTDKDGKTIPYPKKIYTLTNTNSGSFTNPMFTNNCFKPNTSEEDGIPQEFEYNANNVVRYDEQGTSGNTAVGTNIFGGSRYSTMQFLNTPNPTDNYNTLLDSICSASTKALGSLKDSVFYMFEFDGTTNKLTNITSVALNEDQTTFSMSSKYNVLTNLPPIITPLKDAYGIQYDTNAEALKIFKKNNIEKEVFVYKFNYMSYVCPQSQIKNYMRAKRMITPDKFIKYGAATTPNYSKKIQISNTNINTDWRWSNYTSVDFNKDFCDTLKQNLLTSIDDRKREIDVKYTDAKNTAALNYATSLSKYDIANINSSNFSTNYPDLYNTIDLSKSLIGIRKEEPIAKMFDYKAGYNIKNVKSFSLNTGATLNNINNSTDKYMIFTNTGASQTSYTINIPNVYSVDILVVGGGGGGGTAHGGGGGAGALIYVSETILAAGQYTILVGNGGPSAARQTTPTTGYDSSISFGSSTIYLAKGGGGGGHGSGSTGANGGSGGGGNTLGFAGGTPVNTNIPNGIYGNSGGAGFHGASFTYVGGGGGGAGGGGISATLSGGVAYGGNGGMGRQLNITGTATYYAGGGGGGAFSNATRVAGTGGLGGGGNGGTFNETGVDGSTNTGGGGGGGGGGVANSSLAGGVGGSGIVIIRLKLRELFENYSFGALIDNTTNNDNQIISDITIGKSTIQANILSSFIFLQRGTYKFRAAIEGQNYNNNILYSELIIYETIDSIDTIVYRYGVSIRPYEIKIENGKFYKLAFRYISCNFTNSDIINLSFKIYGNDQNLELTNYLFSGANIKRDYANSNIMNLFSNVRYVGNSNTNYISIITYLNNPTIDFFNIKSFYNDVISKGIYKNDTLPNIIAQDKKDDSIIRNIESIINNINRLEGTNPSNNYSSHLPTAIRSIYKDATIDEIFGKNYERLVTKERVSNYSEISNPTIIPTKKIYVEAVA
jgi:hypothetical protein